MLKKLTVLSVIFILLFSVVGLAACDNGTEDGDAVKNGGNIVGNGIASGFEIRAELGEPIPGVFCAYSAETSEFDIDNDVNLFLFYGLVGNYGDDDEVRVSANIIVRNDTQNEMLLKSVEGFTLDNYACQLKSDNWDIGFEIEFLHSENIIIPSAFFVGEKGRLVLSIQVYIVPLEPLSNDETGESNSTVLYYRVENGKIKLSIIEI